MHTIYYTQEHLQFADSMIGAFSHKEARHRVYDKLTETTTQFISSSVCN